MTQRLYTYTETTEWAEPCPNHTYRFTSATTGRLVTCVAYRPEGETEFRTLRTPLKFDLRRRTFREIKD
jgi:hypothetical protein